MAYLGEAYLDLGRTDDANATFLRLAKVCGSVVMGFDNNGWETGCEELRGAGRGLRRARHAMPSGS